MNAPAADPRARFVSGPLGPHVLEMILTGWASMLAVFAVEFLSLFYPVSYTHLTLPTTPYV